MKVLLIVLVLFPVAAFSQTAAPDTTPTKPWIARPLPPSIVAELRRSQKGQAFVFRDTISAQDIARAHFNDTGTAFGDTGAAGYTDSVISMIDTAVSLPHKEWLDSELVEIPELARFGTRMHFNYPPAIMVETNLKPVPFDSKLLAQMNPVIIENLPFFDQSPIPMPLRPARDFESFLEAGAGTVDLPRVSGWLSQSLSERSAVNLLGAYRNFSTSASAIHSYLNLGGRLDAELGPDPGLATFYSSDLAVHAGYSAKNIIDTNTSNADHSLAIFSASAELAGDISKGFHYDASFDDRELSDKYASGATESSQAVALGTQFDLSSWRVNLGGNYSRASMTADTIPSEGTNFFKSISSAISAESLKALLGEHGSVVWNAGIEYLGGNDLAGSHSTLAPVAHVRLPLNARWELGAAFEPRVQLASLQALTDVNPFYSPELVLQSRTNEGTAVDPRSVVIDKINLSAFMNYMLSPDDELRLEAGYIARDREPVFDEIAEQASSNIFIVTPESTDRVSFSAAGNFLLLARDVLSASAGYTFSSIAGQNRAIPFEPNFKFSAGYHFNSIWNALQPQIFFPHTFAAGSHPDLLRCDHPCRNVRAPHGRS